MREIKEGANIYLAELTPQRDTDGFPVEIYLVATDYIDALRQARIRGKQVLGLSDTDEAEVISIKLVAKEAKKGNSFIGIFMPINLLK